MFPCGRNGGVQTGKPLKINTFYFHRKEDAKMAVFRIEKTRDYTVMSNHHLKDRTLTPEIQRAAVHDVVAP